MGKYKWYIIGGIGFLLVLILIDFIIGFRRRPTIVSTITDIASNVTKSEPTPTSTPLPTPTPDLLGGMPSRYKNTPIPKALYQEGATLYRTQNPQEIRRYLLDRVRRYYVYQDFVVTNKLEYSLPSTLSFRALEQAVPEMEKLIEGNLISTIDFMYIKARFLLPPNIQGALEQAYGDLKVKGRTILEEYQLQLRTPDPDLETILDSANKHPELSNINNNELNEMKQQFRPTDKLFAEDKGFNTFLFTQRLNRISPLYTLKNSQGNDYAYVIVYVSSKTNGEYDSVDKLFTDNLRNFK